MAILAIAILCLCLTSVSAVDDNNSTLTVKEDSLESSELDIESNVDEVEIQNSTVDVVNADEGVEIPENGVDDDILTASDDEDVLNKDIDATLTPVSGYTTVGGVITATVNVPVYIQLSGDYDTSYSKPTDSNSVYIRESRYTYDNLLPTTTYGIATSNQGVPLTFSSTGTYTFLFKVPTNYYDIYSNLITVNVVEESSTPIKQNISLDVVVDGEKEDDDIYFGEYGESFSVVTTTSVDFDGTIIYREGEKEIGRSNMGDEFELTNLSLGEHIITAVFEGNDDYNARNYTFTIEIAKKIIWFELNIGDVVLPGNVVGNFSSDGVDGKFTLTIGNFTHVIDYVWDDYEDGVCVFDLGQLPAGNYTVSAIEFEDMDNYEFGTSEMDTINKLPKFEVSTADLPKNAISTDIPSGTANPVFSINLPGANGNLTVRVGNKVYVAKLVNGSASITISDLNAGKYNAVVIYSDGVNNPISKNVTFTVPTPKISGKNVNAVYSAKATYKVLITVNGKAVAGEKVTIKFNGKTYTKKTNAKGYATLSLNSKLKAKSYKINVEVKGVKTTNKLTIKHLIKAKNLKAKKSAKVLKIKVSTNKVNKKYLKGKKLTLKFKGKKFKAKINKKGVATFKVKKNILKKLKVGKKYKYTVSYGKDVVSKKITIKR